jgi:HK97 gp10 family phage protein
MSTSVKLVWHGDRLAKEIKADLNGRLAVVGELVAGQLRRNLSTPGPAASAPGQFPHAQSGRLRQAPTYNVDSRKVSLRIIVPVEYARFLELGTSKMQPRPFLLRTVKELRPQIMAIMAGPRRGFLTRLASGVVNFFRGKPEDFTTTRD